MAKALSVPNLPDSREARKRAAWCWVAAEQSGERIADTMALYMALGWVIEDSGLDVLCINFNALATIIEDTTPEVEIAEAVLSLHGFKPCREHEDGGRWSNANPGENFGPTLEIPVTFLAVWHEACAEDARGHADKAAARNAQAAAAPRGPHLRVVRAA